MVRGTHKQMVVVRTPRNRYFDEAHFLLREGHSFGGECEGSMMAEVNRILDECMLMPRPRHRRLSRLAAFLVGALVGAALLLAAVLLF